LAEQHAALLAQQQAYLLKALSCIRYNINFQCPISVAFTTATTPPFSSHSLPLAMSRVVFAVLIIKSHQQFTLFPVAPTSSSVLPFLPLCRFALSLPISFPVHLTVQPSHYKHQTILLHGFL
jgi:hypothetical protein